MTEGVRRVVTKHNKAGKAVLFSTDKVAFEKWPGADAGSAVVWSTANVPADNSDGDIEGAKCDVGVTLHGGSVFRVTELGPGFQTPMHRTLSTDYCMVLSGTLELVLDAGQRVRLLAGDAAVQRGTNHAWRNPSRNTRCRFMVCMIEAEPIMINGATLAPTPMWKMIVFSLGTLLLPKQRSNAASDLPREERQARNRGLRRVVTTHDQFGKAQVLTEEEMAGLTAPDAGVTGVPIWTTDNVPVNNADGCESAGSRDLGFGSGSVFRVIELEPGLQTPMRRALSIDYCMVLSGELELILDGGEMVTLSVGDTVVQRGTRHAWRNPDKHASCRFAICMIEARRVMLTGKTLEPVP